MDLSFTQWVTFCCWHEFWCWNFLWVDWYKLLQAGLCVLLPHPHHTLSASLPLAQGVLGSFCMFSAPALKATICSQSPSVFQRRVLLRSWALGARGAHCSWGVTLPRPSQGAELGYTCVFTNASNSNLIPQGCFYFFSLSTLATSFSNREKPGSHYN